MITTAPRRQPARPRVSTAVAVVALLVAMVLMSGVLGLVPLPPG